MLDRPADGAMKAAKEIDRILENNGFMSRDHSDQEIADNGWSDTFMGWGRPDFIKYVARKIDYESGLSEKEDALRELVEAVKKETHAKVVQAQAWSLDDTEHQDKVNKAVIGATLDKNAAIAKAEGVLRECGLK